MPEALAVHAVRLALLHLLGDLQGFSERHLRAIQRAATTTSGGVKLDLPRGAVAEATGATLVLRLRGEPGPQALPQTAVVLEVPGEASLGHLRLRAGAKAMDGAYASAELDADAVGSQVCVRGWRPGDRMQPAGMSGTKKLQDLFVDAGVPREERKGIPVFESARGIVWVGGVRLADWARAREPGGTIVLSYREE